jgi:hypothetical protein
VAERACAPPARGATIRGPSHTSSVTDSSFFSAHTQLEVPQYGGHLTPALSLTAPLFIIRWGLGLALLVVFALLSDLSMLFLVRTAAGQLPRRPRRDDTLPRATTEAAETEVVVVVVGYEELGTRLLGPGAGVAVRGTLLVLLGTATITGGWRTYDWESVELVSLTEQRRAGHSANGRLRWAPQ